MRGSLLTATHLCLLCAAIPWEMIGSTCQRKHVPTHLTGRTVCDKPVCYKQVPLTGPSGSR